MSESESKEDVQAFWKSLYASLYDDVDSELTGESLLDRLADLEDMFNYQNHLAVVEMPLADLKGKRVLEIGPGAGGHSALFAKYGAIMASSDLTFDRARATNAKFRLMGDIAEHSHALQSDAENLPYADGIFDIVYSNGVLHHTLDTEKALDEVYRVLKPGGAAVIMLYCKSSWHYWINMLLCVGILQGKIFTGKNWLGRATEWGGKHTQTIENPITRCYTKMGIRNLFAAFENVTPRKGAFFFRLIPKIGRFILHRQVKKYGNHPGGILVYGEPWPIQSPLELKLGHWMGWAWYIHARKPSE
jgi:ubiquinone/menaquinone biosynthesis C-methylase UbiE